MKNLKSRTYDEKPALKMVSDIRKFLVESGFLNAILRQKLS